LGIAKVVKFLPDTKILDAGTGGGFPGIPMAILFPDTHFHLIDSTAKKLTVVQNIAIELGLKNIATEHCRLENHHGKYDFVVSRAVGSLEDMVRLVRKNIKEDGINDLENGLLYLKGGEIENELKSIGARGHGGMEARRRGSGAEGKYTIYDLSDFFTEPFFSTKKLIYLY
jgi:16S rRNA (guanine527-N7)-methyltransferase